MGKKEMNVFVLLNGVWKKEGLDWYIDGGEFSCITVTKYTRYKEFLDKLYDALSVDMSYYDLKIEVAYPCEGQGMPPYAIVDDNGLKQYIREIKSVMCQIALCVNLVSKAGCSYDPNMGFDDCNQYVGTETHDVRKDYEDDEQDNDEYEDVGVSDLPVTCEEEPNLYDAMENPAYEYYLNLELKRQKEQHKIQGPPRQKHSQRSSIDLNTIPNVDITKHTVTIPSFHDSELGGTGYVDREDPVLFDELCLGKVFNCQEDFQLCVSVYAMKNNFEFEVAKSNPLVWYVVCIDRECEWSIRGTRINESGAFKVSAFSDRHTCDADVRRKDNRQAKPWVVGHLIKHKFVDGGHKYLPRHIIADIKEKYGINMTYEKAWRCREKALEYARGTPEDSYSVLPSYLYMLKVKNSDTLTDFVTDDGCEFKYCFFALGACIRGFKHCRPVICIDGSALKYRFGGVMLVAVALDGNNQLYPIAFAIVDSENNDSWTYFMLNLKTAIGDDINGLVFVSDRHQSIAYALDLVFSKSYHGACFYHLKQNIHHRFKTEECDSDFYAAAYAYKESVFARHFRNIQRQNSHVSKYLMDVGVERWARVYFPSNRYNVMTSNYAESLNSTTADARTWPVTRLLEFVRARLQKWFYERRVAAMKSIDRLAPSKEEELRNVDEHAKYLQVRGIDHYQVQVEDGDDSAVVNLDERHCTCGKWQRTGMPCIHTLAAVRHRNVSKYRMCSKFYMIEELRRTYADNIYPVGPMTDWNVPDEIANATVNVPVPRASIGRPKKKLGRPKTKRIPSQGERVVKERKCSRCGGLGHNKASCNRVI